MRYIFTLAIALLGTALIACAPDDTPVVPVAALTCEGTYTATVTMPDHATRIASRNTHLKNRGIAITGNDAIDNAATGGGTPDGGIYLAGTVSWVTGPLVNGVCPVTIGKAVIHGHTLSVSGAMQNPVNTQAFGIAHQGGPITGTFDGKTFSGRLSEGGRNTYVHGLLTNAVFTPVVR